jgi:nucleoside-diphosphate-sugar epimerase
MEIVIAGAHGQIARRLTRQLVARGDSVRGIIRNPDHAGDVEADGATAHVHDLEQAGAADIAPSLEGADAVVFAAGAGPGSGAERKWTMDRDGAIKLLEAAQQAGVERYVIVSSVGAENPPEGDEVFAVYQRAKAAADEAVMASDRAWTVVRPGRLTDDPGAGTVRLAGDPFRTDISRDDVAAVLAAVLHEPATAGLVFYVGSGEDRVEPAVSALISR